MAATASVIFFVMVPTLSGGAAAIRPWEIGLRKLRSAGNCNLAQDYYYFLLWATGILRGASHSAQGKPPYSKLRERRGFQEFFWNCAFSMARWISGLLMKCCQTKPVRAFSAITMVMPASMPMTSGLAQLVRGLKASTNP